MYFGNTACRIAAYSQHQVTSHTFK